MKSNRIARYSQNIKIPNFKGLDTITTNYSQAWQDMFTLYVLDGKRNGFYLEIGAQDPIIKSNTYLFETKFGWDGVSIEIDNKWRDSWNAKRSNRIIFKDAQDIDYKELLKDKPWIDFLQLDTEPPEITFNVLNKIPFDTHEFGVICYEHDLYTGGNARELQIKSRDIFKKHGYILAGGNICNSPGKPFEDWWVHSKYEDRVKNLIKDDLNKPAVHWFI